MEATARMKNGENCDLMERLAAEPEFGLNAAELEKILDPQLYTGRCAEQVSVFLEKIKPMLSGASDAKADIEL